MSILAIVVECQKNRKFSNANIQCDHGYGYSLGKQNFAKTCFDDTRRIKQPPKTTLCKEYKYFKKDKNESEGNIYFPPDNKPTSSSSHFHEEPIVNIETSEERLKDMNVHRVQKRR